MYEKHFHLRERPFALSPDPDYLYPSRVHQEALSYLRYGIEGHAGFVVITGEIGSGKTTMLQSLLGRLDQNTAVARIVNTMLDPRELLESIMLDFGMDPTGMSKPVLLHRLGGFLVQQRQAGRLTLLVIDEAQNLSFPALEEIRMLSNLETEKSKLLQIVLIGQPELREMLGQPRLEQLRQRITVSYHLPPLDAGETYNYINHRLKRAAIGAPMELGRDVTDLIHTRSRGVPRVINVIADAGLLLAYGMDRRDVDVDVVREAVQELDATGVLRAPEGAAEAAPIGAKEDAPAGATGARATAPNGAMGAMPIAPVGAMGATPAAPVGVRSAESLVPASELGPVPAAPVGATAAPESAMRAARVNPPAPNRILAPHPSHQPATVGSHQPGNGASHRPASVPYRTIAPATVLPSGIRVQQFTTVPLPAPGFWERLRRIVFGSVETGA